MRVRCGQSQSEPNRLAVAGGPGAPAGGKGRPRAAGRARTHHRGRRPGAAGCGCCGR
jgi:hypothetical protein